MLMEPSMRNASSGWRFKRDKKPALLDEQYLRGFHRTCVGRITRFRGQGGFGEGLARPEHVDDLLLASGIDPVDVDGPRCTV